MLFSFCKHLLLAAVLFFNLNSSAYAQTDDAKEEKKEAIEKISKPRYVIGGVLGVFPGLGIGHVVQGRWLERGWMMTIGELLSAAVFASGATNCVVNAATGTGSCSTSSTAAVGVTGLVGFRIWELVDIWGEPLWDNKLAILPPTNDSPAMLAWQIHF